jgi:hypothetical protein
VGEFRDLLCLDRLTVYWVHSCINTASIKTINFFNEPSVFIYSSTFKNVVYIIYCMKGFHCNISLYTC